MLYMQSVRWSKFAYQWLVLLNQSSLSMVPDCINIPADQLGSSWFAAVPAGCSTAGLGSAHIMVLRHYCCTVSVLQEVTRQGMPLPVRLVVSGNRAPHLAGPQDDVDPTVLHTLCYTDFWPAFERRYGANPDLVPYLPSFISSRRYLEAWWSSLSIRNVCNCSALCLSDASCRHGLRGPECFKFYEIAGRRQGEEDAVAFTAGRLHAGGDLQGWT